MPPMYRTFCASAGGRWCGPAATRAAKRCIRVAASQRDAWRTSCFHEGIMRGIVGTEHRSGHPVDRGVTRRMYDAVRQHRESCDGIKPVYAVAAKWGIALTAPSPIRVQGARTNPARRGTRRRFPQLARFT